MKKIDENIKVGENKGFSLSSVIEVGDGSFEVKYRAAGGAAQTVKWVVNDGIIGRAALATVVRLS